MNRSQLFFIAVVGVMFLTTACQTREQTGESQDPGEQDSVMYGVQVMQDRLRSLIDADASIEKLGEGFRFTEGPAWHPDGYLLFSDIPQNKIMKWQPGTGVTLYMDSSGLSSGNNKYPGEYQYGSNGLMFDHQNRLVICQHGNRRVARVEADGSIVSLATHYNGKRFNSPNDLFIASNGDIYFTDPPYGLPWQDREKYKELAFNGVYLLRSGGEVVLLDSTLSRPNGIALSPDESALYVANSHDDSKVWYKYDVTVEGLVENKRLLVDATKPEMDGAPDGMAVLPSGEVFATGPGGVWIFEPSGKVLGKIIFPEIPANCSFGGAEGRSLFATARTGLYKIDL